MNAHVTRPTEITHANFATEVMESPLPVVLDFWAPWCGPCRMIGPVLDKLAAEYGGRVKVGKINVDNERQLAGEFQIRGIPTLVALHEGQVAGHMVGFGGEKALEELFAKLAAATEA